MRHRDSHGTTTHATVGQHESGRAGMIFAACTPRLMQRNANHFIAPPCSLVPRSMLRSKNVSVILIGKLIALIERDFKRRIVGLQQYVGNDRLILQFGMLSLLSRILMRPHVPPRPPVETTLLDMRNVVGNKVVAQGVAF